MQQNGQPVSIFFTKLKNVWAEIDQKRPCKIKNQEDIAWYQKEKELERVHAFLRGLDAKHNSAKGELLRMTDPPSLTTTFTYIRKDESQQDSLKHAHVEVSSLAIQAKPPTHFLQQQSSVPLHQQGPPPGFVNRPRPQCSYCNDIGHIRETCWKLNPHLKPKRQGYRPKAKVAAVQLVQEPDFYGVVGQDHHTVGGAIPTVSIAGRGKIGMALKVSNFVGSNTWIIDSGASDHMTYDKSYFTELSSPPVSYVTNANGEAFPVLGTRSIRITPTLQLHNVLYVPDLSHHLISVPQLNTKSKCFVTFYLMYVIFQDLLTRETIGRGYLRGRLFHLDQTYAGEKPGAQSRTALTSNSDKLSEIWLWHRRLGHPSFTLMKKPCLLYLLVWMGLLCFVKHVS